MNGNFITGLKVRADEAVKLFKGWKQDRRDFNRQVNVFGMETVAIRNLPVLILRDENDELSHVAARVIYEECESPFEMPDDIPVFFPHYFRLSDGSEVNMINIVGWRDIREFMSTETLFEDGLTSADVKYIDQTAVVISDGKAENGANDRGAYGKK